MWLPPLPTTLRQNAFCVLCLAATCIPISPPTLERNEEGETFLYPVERYAVFELRSRICRPIAERPRHLRRRSKPLTIKDEQTPSSRKPTNSRL
jgi:hypothetical protein